MTRKYKWRPWYASRHWRSIAIEVHCRVEPDYHYRDSFDCLVQTGWVAYYGSKYKVFSRRCQAKRWVEWMISLEAKK